MRCRNCLSIVVACLILTPSLAQAVVIWGRVVDENNEPVTGRTVITVAKRDGTRINATTEDDGSYKIDVPSGGLSAGDVIDSIRFRRADRHPAIISQVAGQLPVIDPKDPTTGKTKAGGAIREDYANKVMFPRVGPQGYERNMAQLQVYEYLYYTEMGEGKSREELRRDYAWLLTGMPRVDDMERLPELNTMQRDMLKEKRSQVYRLYGIVAPESPPPAPATKAACCPKRGLFHRRR